MSRTMLAGMLEATRLTQAGRLADATAMIQRALNGDASGTVTSPGTQSADEPIEGLFKVVGRRRNVGPAATARAANDPIATSPVWPSVELPGMPTMPGKSRRAPADVVPDGGRFIDGTFRNQAGARSYKLYIPSNYRGQALPLVVMLHGCTQDPDDFAAGTRMNHLAEERECLALYPAQSSAANMQKCWNWFNAGDQRRDSGEPCLIVGLVQEVAAHYGVDRARIYAAGLSSGGAMAAILGATYPDVFAAVGVHSGLAPGAARDMPSAFAAMRQGGRGLGSDAAPTIVFHGDLDTTVHPRNGDHVIAHAAAAIGEKPRVTREQGQGAGGRTYTREVYRDGQGAIRLEHWRIHGAGHAWSGGGAGGSYADPRGPDATREMLRFFYEHPLAASSSRTH